MDEKFIEEFETLIGNYTDLLLGKEDEELRNKVKIWMLYSSMSKNMPGLVKHWNAKFPESKQAIIDIIGEIKTLNEIERQKRK